jgi:hypothetical protein
MDCHLSTQEMLAGIAGRSEEVSQTRSHPFGGIGMNFKDVILIVIACPFFATMCHGGMLALDALVRLVFIREDMTGRPGKTMKMSDQRFGLRRVNDTQTDLSA